MHLKIIKMNVFGGTRSRGGKGPRGPRGFPGKDSSISDLNLFMKKNFPPESTKDYLWQWGRMDRMIELSDYQKCKEKCDVIALKGKQGLPISYDKENRIGSACSSYCEILRRLTYYDFKDSIDVRSKEMIIWEIVNLIELGVIDSFLAKDILTKLATKPNYIKKNRFSIDY